MKKFEEMTAQRQEAHRFFDKVLDLRVQTLEVMLTKRQKPRELARLATGMEEAQEALDGATEVVAISEVVDRAVDAALANVAPTPGSQQDGTPPPKRDLEGSSPSSGTDNGQSWPPSSK
jgi:hypothetical protein